MKAELLLDRRVVLGPAVFAELVVWRTPVPVRGSHHDFKYRLALIADRICVLRYDNEAGKGDHRHVGGVETDYRFTSFDDLIDDFLKDCATWLSAKTGT
jgi:hypothetical protein